MKHCFIKAGVLAAAVFTASAGLASNAFAQGASLNGSGAFSLQGQLTNPSGSAIANGTHMLAVNIYANGSSQAVYSELDTVNTTNGIFSTMIGANGSSALKLNGTTNYAIGIAVDGQAELMPHIAIGEVPNAINANTALSANTVAGFSVDSTGLGLPHSLVTLNQQGKLAANVLDSNVVTTINGSHGAVNIMGGGNLSVTSTQGTDGTTLNLGFTGSGAGLTLPFTQTVDLASGNVLSITNTLAGNTAAFVNTGLGNAVKATATTGVAINATSLTGAAVSASSTGSLTDSAAIIARNMFGTAIDAVTTSGSAINASATTGSAIAATATAGSAINATAAGTTHAVLNVQGSGSTTGSTLISATNGAASNVFNVSADGATQIQSSASTALTATTTATGGTAAKLTGGLSLVGPTGTGSIASGSTSATISNAYAKANSMVFVTLSSAAGISVPLTVTSVTDGSFTVAPVGGLSLANTLSFNYLIVNPQ